MEDNFELLFILGAPGFLCLGFGLAFLPIKLLVYICKRLSGKKSDFQDVYIMLVYPFLMWRDSPKKKSGEDKKTKDNRIANIYLMISYFVGGYMLLDYIIIPLVEKYF